MQDLQQIFTSFASFGNRRVSKEEGPVEMDGARFAKLAKDCKLLDKKFTATDVDLTFSKARLFATHALLIDVRELCSECHFPEQHWLQCGVPNAYQDDELL